MPVSGVVWVLMGSVLMFSDSYGITIVLYYYTMGLLFFSGFL